jgi:SAM-dependent methyltransferase
MTVPQIFDRRVYAQRRARARPSFLAADVGESLAMRLGAVNRRFTHGLELSARGEISQAVAGLAEHWTRTTLTAADGAAVVCDEEALPFAPESFDLVVSALSLHAVNDLPGTLAQIRRVLKPDGLFLGALFAGDTLSELRHAFTAGEADITGGISPRVSPFADIRDLGGLLQRAGFALPVADAEKTIVRYRTLSGLFDDLRALGETNVLTERARQFLRRDVLASALAHYASEHSDPEGLGVATFEIVYLTAWGPHESQQKPLKPGSAAMRLADALKVSDG